MGLLLKELNTEGEPIDVYDRMAVDDARSRGLILVTRNVSEFERVPGFRVGLRLDTARTCRSNVRGTLRYSTFGSETNTWVQ